MNRIKNKIIVVFVLMLLLSIYGAGQVVSEEQYENNPPNNPELDGPGQVKIGEEFTLSMSSIDPDGYDVKFQRIVSHSSSLQSGSKYFTQSIAVKLFSVACCRVNS